MIAWPARSDAAELTDEQLLEKLSGFGVRADRADIERLCEGALSVEEVAQPLLERCGVGAGEGQPNPDWIWLCLLELWRRWWPERVCVEFLGDKIQAGYDALERQEAASAPAVKRRSSLVRRLRDQTAGVVELEAVAERCEESDDALDALVCALVARAAEVGAVRAVGDCDRARCEGWIRLPTPDSLSRLSAEPRRVLP